MSSRFPSHDRFGHGVHRLAGLVALCGVVACSHQDADPPPTYRAARPASTTSAAAPARPVTQLAEDLYVVSTRDGNAAVLVGKDSSLIVGPQVPSLDSAARALLTAHHAGPVRFVVVTPADSAPAYGDGGWGSEHALVIAHENLLARMMRLRRSGAALPARASRNGLPTMGFSEVVQIHVSDNWVHAIHHQPGYSNADLIVHFENRNVIYLGNAFTNDGYPVIDLSRGGSIAGMIELVQGFKGFSPTLHFVPGRGPVATKSELDDYGAMLASVVERVQRMIDAGQSEAQVVAAKPTASFDARWGHGPVGADAFVRMVYESLTAKQSAGQ